MTPRPVQLSAPQWRQFTFFDLEDVKDADDISQSPRALRVSLQFSQRALPLAVKVDRADEPKDLAPPIVLTPTSPASPLAPSVILASGNNIAFLDRQFAPERSFRAWEGTGRATALVEAGGLPSRLVRKRGVGIPCSRSGTSRGMRSARGQNCASGPVLMRNVRIQHGQRPHPVSRTPNPLLQTDRVHADVKPGLFHRPDLEPVPPSHWPRRRNGSSLPTPPAIPNHVSHFAYLPSESPRDSRIPRTRHRSRFPRGLLPLHYRALPRTRERQVGDLLAEPVHRHDEQGA